MKNRNDKLTIINKLVPDKNIQDIIFNFDNKDNDFLSDEKICLTYLSNILAFAAMVSLNAFLMWKSNLENKEIKNSDYSNSMLRIYNMLDRVYDSLKINGDFIDDLIINLQIDYLLDSGTQTSFLEAVGISRFFNFPKTNNKLSRYIFYLKQNRISSKSKYGFGFDQLCECIKMFPFLRETKADFVKKNVATGEVLGIMLDTSECDDCFFKKIDLKHSLCMVSDMVYYMEDFNFEDVRKFDEDGKKNQKVELNYIQFGGIDCFKIVLINGEPKEVEESFERYYIYGDTVIEDFLLDYDIINISSNNLDSVFFRDYILLNNRYIKELALTISDTLSVRTKNEIIRRYSSKYEDIFHKMYVTSFYNKKDAFSYRWDEIVLFLLLEEGIYDFLRFLLAYEKYESFKNSFCRRFGKGRIEDICNSEPFILNPEENVQYTTAIKSKFDCQARALILLASKLLTLNEWNQEKSYYPTTIDDIILEVDRVYESENYYDSEKVLYFVNTVLRVGLFINTFYHGIFAYARSKRSAILDLEEKGIYYSNYKKYIEAKDDWILQMKDEVKKYKHQSIFVHPQHQGQIYTKASKENIINRIEEVFSCLLDTNEKMCNRNSDYNEVLFETLGKRKLFETKEMRNYEKKIISALRLSQKRITSELHSTVRDFLYYLKTGNSGEYKNMDMSHIVENAIYPIVGQYNRGVTSRDGYRFSYFKVDFSNDSNKQTSINIKMVTDDEFDFGYSYYCVPNINRVAGISKKGNRERIWISPIIIPCSVFLPQLATQIDILDDEKNFEEVIDLIYESDSYVYKRFFGSLENARKILPLLFENEKSKFSKTHYYVLKQEEQVVAIASRYKASDYRWDTDIERKAFLESGIEPPETFEMAVNYLKDIFDDCIGSTFWLVDDVCVKEEWRNRGIGKSLIMYLSRKSEVEGKSIILSVYSENNIAINLYSSVGFIPYLSNDDSSNIGRHYFKMIKK